MTAGRRELCVRRRREMGTRTRKHTWGRLIPITFGFKDQGDEFCEFAKPVELGAWSFNSQLTQHWAIGED